MAKFRKRLKSYVPVWEGFVEAIAVNHVRRNVWRLPSYMEEQDALQEARMVFMRVKDKYPLVSTPQHFNALYSVSLVNHMNKLVTRAGDFKHHRNKDAVKYTHVNVDDCSGELESLVDYNDGMLGIMMEQAPKEIKSVLRLFLTAPVEVLEHLTHIMMERSGPSDFDDKHLCKILGLRKGTKVRKKIYQYFQI